MNLSQEQVSYTLVEEGLGGFGIESLLVGFPTVIALAACFIAYRQTLVAGLLFTDAYTFQVLRPLFVTAILGRRFDIEAITQNLWWFISLPWLIAGVMLIVSWGLDRTPEQKGSGSPAIVRNDNNQGF